MMNAFPRETHDKDTFDLLERIKIGEKMILNPMINATWGKKFSFEVTGDLSIFSEIDSKLRAFITSHKGQVITNN
jgi:hypothetical protein